MQKIKSYLKALTPSVRKPAVVRCKYLSFRFSILYYTLQLIFVLVICVNLPENINWFSLFSNLMGFGYSFFLFLRTSR
jgi:hypothetical protein